MNNSYWRNPSNNFAPAPPGLTLGTLVCIDVGSGEIRACESGSDVPIAIVARVKGERGLRLVYEGPAYAIINAPVGANIYQGEDGQIVTGLDSGVIIGRIADRDGDFVVLQVSAFGQSSNLINQMMLDMYPTILGPVDPMDDLQPDTVILDDYEQELE